MRMLVCQERSYPARRVQGKDGSCTVAADSLVPELLDGIKSLDPAVLKLDEEIQELAGEELVEIIYEWQWLWLKQQQQRPGKSK